MIIKLEKEEIETLLKILSDYESVMMRRIMTEIKKKDFRNIKGKQDFIFNFLGPLRFKIRRQELEQTEEGVLK